MQNIKISPDTLNNFIIAVQKAGESKVNEVLIRMTDGESKVIDEITNLCCDKMNINKSFLFIPGNRKKKNCLIVIIYYLKKNNISTSSITQYFKDYTIRVSDYFSNALNLNELIPDDKYILDAIKNIRQDAQIIFDKYLINF
jgi:hypothetical protein